MGHPSLALLLSRHHRRRSRVELLLAELPDELEIRLQLNLFRIERLVKAIHRVLQSQIFGHLLENLLRERILRPESRVGDVRLLPLDPFGALLAALDAPDARTG